MSNQLAILEYVHLCKPQYKSTAVDELLNSCFDILTAAVICMN